MTVSRDRQHRDDAVDALAEPAEHPLDHGVVDERPRGVVDEDDERVVGTSASAFRTDSARVAPPVTTAATFEATSSSARRIVGSSHSGGAATTIASTQSRGVEPLEALGEQRPSRERRERLRPVAAEPRAGAGGDEDRPGVPFRFARNAPARILQRHDDRLRS